VCGGGEYSSSQVEVFWIVTPCSVAVVYHRFGGPLLPPSSAWRQVSTLDIHFNE